VREFEFLTLGGAFGFSLLLTVLAAFFYYFREKVQIPVGRELGFVSTSPLGWMNLVAVGFIYVFYLVSWSFEWGKWFMDAVKIEDLVNQLVLQACFVVVVGAMLFDRTSYVAFWGLKPKRWLFVSLVAIGGFLAFILILEALWHLGHDDWAAQVYERSPMRIIGEPDSGFLMVSLTGVVMALGAPITEEVVFRGYIYPVIKRMGGVWIAAVASSLLFSAAHLDGTNLIPGFLMGLLLVLAYEGTGSLWTSIGIHGLNNLYVFIYGFS